MDDLEDSSDCMFFSEDGNTCCASCSNVGPTNQNTFECKAKKIDESIQNQGVDKDMIKAVGRTVVRPRRIRFRMHLLNKDKAKVCTRKRGRRTVLNRQCACCTRSLEACCARNGSKCKANACYL